MQVSIQDASNGPIQQMGKGGSTLCPPAPRNNPLVRPFPVPRKSAKPRQQAAEPRRDLPRPRRHSQLRGPHGPREPGGSGCHASRAGDLDTLRPHRKQRRRGTHRAEEGPPPRTQAAAGHEQRREAATAAAPAPQQQAAVSHGGLGPLSGARRHGAKAGVRQPSASAACRFSGNRAPRAHGTRGSTRTHAPHAYVKPRPGVRTSTCPLGGRPRPWVGRGEDAQALEPAEGGTKTVAECGGGRGQRRSRVGLGRG